MLLSTEFTSAFAPFYAVLKMQSFAELQICNMTWRSERNQI